MDLLTFQEFGYVHLSAGDLLRAERAKKGPVGEMIEEHIRNGTIVPVEVTCGLLHQVCYAVSFSRLAVAWPFAR